MDMIPPPPAGATLAPPPPPKGATQFAPAQGNMYTQSAQDIQYSPEGIPLNTSSYGAETTGNTDLARKGLTAAVFLPINMATGAAKNVGGVAQMVDRYFGGGGKTADQFVNALDQIESGTQKASGNIGGAVNAVGSAIGQAAPWLAGGAGTIPSFAKAVESGFVTGAGSALATPEQTGLTPDQFEEAKKKNILMQSGLGVAMPVIGQLGSKIAGALRGTTLSPQMAGAVEKAREAGYTVPPTQAGGGALNRLLEGISGKASTLQEASVRNQEVTNKLAVKSLGLPENTVLTPEVLGTIRSDAGLAYEALKELPKKAAVTADSTMNRIASAEINPAKMVEDLKIARADAEGYYNAYARSAHPEDLAKAKAFKSKATQLEDGLEQYAKDMGKEDLVPALRDARQLIAKTYTVENAMNKTTGTVDAKEFAKRLQKGKPMSEELTQIGQFAQAFPKAAQMPEKIGGTIGISPLDVTAAGIAGGASLLGGEDKTTSGALSLATLLARPLARKAVLSDRMQNRLIQQEAAPASPIRQTINQALPSYDEAKQLAKMLLMQKAGSTSENRK